MNLFFFNNFLSPFSAPFSLHYTFLLKFYDDHDFYNLFNSTNYFKNINFGRVVSALGSPQLLDWWCYCCFGFFSLSATARILCSSTDPGVAGITTGAAYPLRANQFRFFSFLSLFLSTFR